MIGSRLAFASFAFLLLHLSCDTTVATAKSKKLELTIVKDFLIIVDSSFAVAIPIWGMLDSYLLNS